MCCSRSLLWPLAASLLVGLCLLPLLAPTVTTAYGGADGGELASAVWRAAVAHPPGYPTYLVFGQVALLVPCGEVAWRLALLNLVALCWSVACVTATLQYLLKPEPWSNLCAVIGGLILGFNPFVIQQTLIVEVYVLALACWATLLWLIIRWWKYQHNATLWTLGLVFGLGLGVQLPLMALWGGCALVWVRQQRLPRWSTMYPPLVTTCVGLLIYLVLPWRGQAEATSWGDWSHLQGAFDHITAQEYRYLVGIVEWPERFGRLALALQDLVFGLYGLGFAFALWGLLNSQRMRWRWLTGGSGILTLLWAVTYGGADGRVYVLPLHLLACYWSAIGLQVFLQACAPKLQLMTLIGVLIGIIAIAMYSQRYTLANNTITRDQAIARLESQPFAGRIETTDDQDTFPLWYAQRVLHIRPDVQVIDQRLCQRSWYQPCRDSSR